MQSGSENRKCFFERVNFCCADLAPCLYFGGPVDKKTFYSASVISISLSKVLICLVIFCTWILTEGVKQSGVYVRLLLRLRDGNSTEDDWKMLMESCTEQYSNEDQVQRSHVSKTMWLFDTNKENHTHNIKQLKLLNKPIVLLNAEHDNSSTKLYLLMQKLRYCGMLIFQLDKLMVQ